MFQTCQGINWSEIDMNDKQDDFVIDPPLPT